MHFVGDLKNQLLRGRGKVISHFNGRRSKLRNGSEDTPSFSFFVKNVALKSLAGKFIKYKTELLNVQVGMK